MNIMKNMTSGFLVFLIALPLCLGISTASGFPPIAGVLTAIVGGVLLSHIGSARLTIKGPAAGLIVIALGSVNELGILGLTEFDPIVGYRRALAVGVIAAVIQIIFAITKVGRFAKVMPTSVVHGMLAAIGIIIIAKQFPVLMGIQGAKGEPLEMLMEIPHYIGHADPIVAGIGLLSVALLFISPLIPGIKKLPAPLLVLLVAIPLSLFYQFSTEHSYTLGGHEHVLSSKLLVQLPGSLMDSIVFPDFSVVTSGVSIKYIIMFALVGTVESLLSVIAVDSIDPEKHASDLNKDLLATGLGNLVCGLIGGLPMISEIVRSKANIDAKATSSWSNFFHGLFLLAFVALLPDVLQMIPLTALAAMLVVTGTRLASPTEFKHAKEIGNDQLIIFLTTCIVTLATDLLVGVGVGILLKLIIHSYRAHGIKPLFQKLVETEEAPDVATVRVRGAFVFTNFFGVEAALEKIHEHHPKQIVLDVSEATLVDHTVQECLHKIADEWEDTKLEMRGLDKLTSSSKHEAASRWRKDA